MGSANSRSSVVDPNLRVIGIKHLRVVDASVFPDYLSSQNTGVIMVAEKAADMIKREYNSPY